MNKKNTLSFKQQLRVLRRLFKAAKPFWWQFVLATVAALVLSIVNLILPRMI